MRRLRQKRYTSTARANRESRATEQDREHGAEIRADHILGQLGWYEEFNAALAPLREPLHATELFGHRMEPDDALDYVQAQLRYDLVAMLRLVAAIVRQDDEEDG